MKKNLVLFVIIALIVGMTPRVSAVESTLTGSTTLDRANALKDLGLFLGSNNGFDLDRTPSRVEALVLLLRMLGEEKEAQNITYTNPFADVPTWAEKHVAYAYNKGYTNGISATLFGSNNIAAPEQFLGTRGQVLCP